MSNFKTTVDETEQIKLIEELRELKETKGMTYQEISDKTAENNEYVSVSNIKKVFSHEHKHNHDYKRTLLPIFNALVDVNDIGSPVNHIYQTRLEIKNETIRQLEEEVYTIKNEYKERLKTKDEKHKDREEFYMQQIEFLQQQIKFKDEQIKHHNETIDRKDAALREVYAVIIGTKSAKEVFS